MNTILVGVDGSERTRDVIATARELAKNTNARLILLRVATLPVGIPPEAMRVEPFRLEEIVRAEAEEKLNAIARTLPPELVAGVEVRIGTPWSAICELARARSVDLIVIGSHGYDALDHLIGTTAAKVVNHAVCSVCVVRAPAKAKSPR